MRSLKFTVWFFLLFFASGLLAPASTDYAYIDPNATAAPQEIQDLKLSFRLNQTDIMAPFILMGDDGTKAFTNYIYSDKTPEVGYVLVVHPQELNPANQFIKAIAVGKRPGLMYYNPTHTEIWVLNLGNFGSYPDTQCSISVIDTATLAVTKTIDLSTSNFGFGSNIVFTDNGGTAYVASTLTDEIVKIDAVQHTVTSRLKLLSQNPYYYISVGPTQLTLSHNGAFICCTNAFNDTVSVINTSTFTETFQILFTRESSETYEHTPNFTFRNNVLLNEDDTMGYVASIGAPLALYVPDMVYLFNPATGKRYKDTDGKFHDIAIYPGDPMNLQLDPNNELLLIQVISYDKVDSVGSSLRGYPAIQMMTWPDLQYFKKIEFKSPDYNMSTSTQMGFVPNGDGTYDLLYPSFSTFNTAYISNYREVVPRVSLSLYEQCTSLVILNSTETRRLPVTLVMIPGSTHYLVADYLTGALQESEPSDNATFSSAFRIFIESGHFSSVALLNPTDQPITYWVQSFQTDDTATEDDDARAGYPFFWVDTSSTMHIIEPYALTLNPGQQLVRMASSLVPDYDKVSGQHGFMKAAHVTEPLRGVVFNGKLADDGSLIRGEYLRINPPARQDLLFPCLFSTTDVATYIHVVNPYMNYYTASYSQYLWSGTDISDGTGSWTVSGSSGIDSYIGSKPVIGWVRLFNSQNLLTSAYQTVEGKNTAAQFLYTCPPLNPQLPSASAPFYVPYYAVGGGYDTTLWIISEAPRTIAGVVDGQGNLINQYTHMKLEFFDFNGNLTLTKEFDFINHSQFVKSLSQGELLNHDKYSAEVLTGSIRITVDQNSVCGAYSYTLFREPPTPETDPLLLFKNMTMDELRFGPDSTLEAIFPYTINIAPYYTSYVLFNPNDAPASVRIEVYNSEGQLVGTSIADPVIQPHAQLIFFLGEEWLFGQIPDLTNFVGYMKVYGTNGKPFVASSIQGSADMMTIIPTL